MTVRVMGDRRTNADLVVDLVALGHLRSEWVTLDATYGKGRFWRRWRPEALIRSDLHTGTPGTHDLFSDVVHAWDFTALPWPDESIDVIVLDPPYKLNGTSGRGGPASSDLDYGVNTAASWQDRYALIEAGIAECGRVARHRLLVKCQDQVVSGRKRFQTRDFAAFAEARGWRLADMLHVGGHRVQPPGRRQVHAHQDYSTMLVFVPGGQR